MTEKPYSTLLKTDRLRTSTLQDRSIILEAESDRGRLLFCPAFRRLQQKAQVFSMEPNAAVRSRLTHSLEVSQMGRYIADSIVKKLKEKQYATEEECTALVTFVETACLMHDIGNPPFGHFGEAAIANWFQNEGKETIGTACSGTNKSETPENNSHIDRTLADFLEFDGNPQGLRVVTKLQRNNDEHGLNLTKTTIAAYLKYLRTSGEEIQKASVLTKKCGFFQTEKKIVENIWSSFGYTTPQRFPLTYIMEAADDLAYCISDLEDAIEKGLLDQKNAFNDLKEKWTKNSSNLEKTESFHRIEAILEENKSSTSTYIDFRTKLNREIVIYCADRYIEKHNEILSGSLDSLIEKDSPEGCILNTMKELSKEKVYCHESVQRIELAGYTAIYGLLTKFKCLLECDIERFELALKKANKDKNEKPILLETKYLSLFPKNYIKAYQDDLKDLDIKSNDFKLKEWNLRAHLITDFISGMTDDFAMLTYRTLSGMTL